MSNLETIEVNALNYAREATIKEELDQSLQEKQMTWKEYCACYDKHLSVELILAKVIF